MMKFLKNKFKLKTEKEISYNHTDKEEDQRILYYEFKESIVRMEYTDIHYLDHTFNNIKNSSFSFKNKKFINKSINNLIYKFSDSIFKEQLFYNLLERNIHQNNPKEIYLKIYNNLIKQIQEHIDIIVHSRLRYFTGGVSFYKEYNKFKTNDNLNYFLIENLFKELKLNEYYLTFQLKNSYDAILLEYFKQSVIYIRENEDVYNCSKIKSEINRLKSEILKNDFFFLKGYIDLLEELNDDLDYIKTTETKKSEVKKEESIIKFMKNWLSSDNIDLDLKNILRGNLNKLKKGSINSDATNIIDIGRIFFQLSELKIIDYRHLEVIYQNEIIIEKIYIENNIPITKLMDKTNLKAHKNKFKSISILYKNIDIRPLIC